MNDFTETMSKLNKLEQALLMLQLLTMQKLKQGSENLDELAGVVSDIGEIADMVRLARIKMITGSEDDDLTVNDILSIVEMLINRMFGPGKKEKAHD